MWILLCVLCDKGCSKGWWTIDKTRYPRRSHTWNISSPKASSWELLFVAVSRIAKDCTHQNWLQLVFELGDTESTTTYPSMPDGKKIKHYSRYQHQGKHLNSEVLINWMSCWCFDSIDLVRFDFGDWVIVATEDLQKFISLQFNW